MLRPIITLTTDFGDTGSYVAQMKAAILSVNRDVMVVDVSHTIGPQDIRQAAIVLDEVFDFLPPDSINVAVVDPGVGSARAIIYARFAAQHFIAPDNGLLSLVALRYRPAEIIRLTNCQFWRDEVSTTFHGRDIMAPVAGHLSLGVSPAELGAPLSQLTMLDWPHVRHDNRSVVGQIITIDSFGNLITNIVRSDLAAILPDHRPSMHIGGHRIDGVIATYSDAQIGSLVASFGSSDRLEVAVVNGSAARHTNSRVGDEVRVAW
jgi:hypothetical protein